MGRLGCSDVRRREVTLRLLSGEPLFEPGDPRPQEEHRDDQTEDNDKHDQPARFRLTLSLYRINRQCSIKILNSVYFWSGDGAQIRS